MVCFIQVKRKMFTLEAVFLPFFCSMGYENSPKSYTHTHTHVHGKNKHTEKSCSSRLRSLCYLITTPANAGELRINSYN